MYFTARPIRTPDNRRLIPQGVRLSDVYQVEWGNQFYAIAHHDGDRIKVVVSNLDLTAATPSNAE